MWKWGQRSLSPFCLWVFLLAQAGWSQGLPAGSEAEFRRAVQSVERGDYPGALAILVPLERANSRSFEIQHLLAIVLDVTGKPQEANRHFQNAAALNPGSAVAHANLGTSYARIGRTGEAVVELRRALKIDPANATANYNLGSIFLQQKRFKDALPLLEKAHRLQPAVYENGYQYALCSFLLGELGRADKVLDALMPVPEERSEFYLLLALTQKATGKEGAAQKTMQQVLPLLAKQPQSYEQVVPLLFSQGMYREALPVLGEAARRFPEAPAVWAGLAEAEFRTGELPAAEEHARRALAIRDSAEGRLLLADILEASDQPLEALDQYQRAAKLDPSEGNLIALGYEFMLHWNWKEAQQILTFAAAKHEESWRVRMGLGAAYLGEDDFENAAQWLLRALDLAPEEAMGYQLLAQSFGDSAESFERAVARFQTYYEAHPGDPRAAYYYVLAAYRRSVRGTGAADPEAWIRLLREAIAKKPDLADAQFLLGEICFSTRDWPAAIAAYEETVKYNPAHIEGHYKLGLSLQRVGQTERAKAELALYQELKDKESRLVGERLAGTVRFLVAPKK